MSKSPKVRYSIAPDPMQQLVMAVLPKRAVDKIFAKRPGCRHRHAEFRHAGNMFCVKTASIRNPAA
jgi:hypothetical protein